MGCFVRNSGNLLSQVIHPNVIIVSHQLVGNFKQATLKTTHSLWVKYTYITYRRVKSTGGKFTGS